MKENIVDASTEPATNFTTCGATDPQSSSQHMTASRSLWFTSVTNMFFYVLKLVMGVTPFSFATSDSSRGRICSSRRLCPCQRNISEDRSIMHPCSTSQAETVTGNSTHAKTSGERVAKFGRVTMFSEDEAANQFRLQSFHREVAGVPVNGSLHFFIRHVAAQLSSQLLTEIQRTHVHSSSLGGLLPRGATGVLHARCKLKLMKRDRQCSGRGTTNLCEM